MLLLLLGSCTQELNVPEEAKFVKTIRIERRHQPDVTRKFDLRRLAQHFSIDLSADVAPLEPGGTDAGRAWSRPGDRDGRAYTSGGSSFRMRATPKHGE